MQHLAGPDKVRYLAENAGSMARSTLLLSVSSSSLIPKIPRNSYGMPLPMELRYREDETFLEDILMLKEWTPVFLFCLAMDPLFHYLNRIPDVLSVQAYVDDTTVIGDAQNLDWVGKVSDCYQKLSSAGFIIEPHQCFRCCANSVMKFLPRYVTDEYLAENWPELIQGKPFATIHAALQAALQL